MNESIRNSIDPSLLARNATLNFGGQVAVAIVAVITIPFVIRGLGTDAFGILSLVWVFLGYFSLFDLGLGRATTKFAAEHLGRGEIARVPGLVWTSLWFQLFLGILGGIVLAAAVPILVGRVFNIPPALVGEAKDSFLILVASLPIVLGTTVLRSVLEAGQRFDLVNAVKIPAHAATFLIPSVGVSFGARLRAIVFLLVVARLAAALAYLLLCRRVFPSLREGLCFDSQSLRRLLTYGSWVTVSNVVTPVLLSLDRMLISSLISMAALAYYTAPYQLATAFLIVPASLVATVFPAFSTLSASGFRETVGQLYLRSLKFLLLTLGPLVLLVVFFAHHILRVWLGADFAEQSTVVLQILAIGVLVNSTAWVSFSLLQGVGRPDLTAKFLIVELPLYAGLAWFLIGNLGVVGAALAWSLWLGVDAIVLFGACGRLRFVSVRMLVENGLLRGVLVLFVLAVTLLLTVVLAGAAVVFQAALVAVQVALFALAAWSYVLDSAEKRFLRSAIPQLVFTGRGAQ